MVPFPDEISNLHITTSPTSPCWLPDPEVESPGSNDHSATVDSFVWGFALWPVFLINTTS